MTGYRAWLVAVSPDRTTLNSLTFTRHKWSPGVNQAEHLAWPPMPSEDHPAPLEKCSCGIWVLPSVNDVLEYLSTQALTWMHFVRSQMVQAATIDYDPPVRHVIGSVQVWGRMIEHQTGLRCEYAQITALYNASDLAERYDVLNVSSLDDLKR
jgi:hypothetical protein